MSEEFEQLRSMWQVAVKCNYDLQAKNVQLKMFIDEMEEQHEGALRFRSDQVQALRTEIKRLNDRISSLSAIIKNKESKQ